MATLNSIPEISVVLRHSYYALYLWPITGDVMTMEFVPTRAAGLDRLAAFVPRAGRLYADGRNVDNGPNARQAVSLLSPYVRYRLLSEAEIVHAVLAKHSHQACEKFVQEVLWRTYWKGWLELRPSVWSRFVIERDGIGKGGGLAKAIAQAECGSTGIDGFDDWARELVEHGYLHNHARMWFASIWIFTLGLPWAAGADFFLRHLIDADPASNTLSWRWVAGLQTAGKTYLATADNIARNTGGRFSPKGLATRAVALTEMPISGARPLAPLPRYDASAPALLLLTGEDLTPEQVLPRTAAIRAIIAVDGALGWPWGDDATAFVSGALDDAATRAAAHFGCTVAHSATLDPASIIAAAQAAGAAVVITPYAPVGPVADALAAIAAPLAEEGLSLTPLRRDWDERFWPHATRGFFPFKERIPTVLKELNYSDNYELW
jgi:deoxyribodipyrimidine photo-lyase